ncbi:RidA family protein [Azospirillum rugosum]|uniref:Enamine deaminase RidA (YjgF/YER057c/UK114 family) n=1 Tax=Azospirillum rugosum TaxID=416170 RepID=A0ABS4SK16_9PROT|nr:RidA family protein [Azospirillum rugosum]MBP2292904.1 enamine deaminase RidA (YjgF/YER057c/UK114 family) [Azospirillum rugosum]MDQ0529344.1 enamine deaminase RidA (YjgF/YER057c/UK114 family) [Azospirillum rugosum]
MEAINPPDMAGPLGHYTQGILVPRDHDWLCISGQVGVSPDGIVPDRFDEQARLCWENIGAVLRAAGMGVEHLVKTTVFLTDAADLPAFGPVRTAFLGTHKPASTLLIVKGLARPEWRVEIEAVAARPASR